MELYILLFFLIILYALALLIGCVGVGLMLIAAISLWIEVPFVRTPRALYPPIVEALGIQQGDVVYELGSGDGGFILSQAVQFPDTRFVGIERNMLLHAFARLRKRIEYGNPPNVFFRRGNIFSTDFSEATKIYAYLLSSVMDALLPAFERELQAACIASRAFQFKQREASRIVELSKKPGNHGQHLFYVYDFTK